MSNRPHRTVRRRTEPTPIEVADQVLTSCDLAGLPEAPRPLVLAGGEEIPGWRTFQFGLIVQAIPEFDDDMSFECRQGWEMRAKAVLEKGCPECDGGFDCATRGRKVISAVPHHEEGCSALHPAVIETMAAAPFPK